MWFGIVSLFPEMFQALNAGITGRALEAKLLELQFWNPRDYDLDKYKSADDHPYGGGPGMLMKPYPLQQAIHAAKAAAPTPTKVIYLSPQGKLLTQAAAIELANHPSLILVAGRYEGIDERVISQEIDEEWSIGDYVVSGGELPAMVMIDTLTRLLPNALGDAQSTVQDSLFNGLLKYPQYTRPETFNGENVPAVLLSGNHKDIEKWRLKQSLGQTWLKRPDLLVKKELTLEQQALLNEWIDENPTKKARKPS
jgi:tRNA (guanine37-N1)-methyltransferase